jgi:hypothetical protein
MLPPGRSIHQNLNDRPDQAKKKAIPVSGWLIIFWNL